MSVPISQIWTVSTYVLAQKLRRRKRYPLVLMLEPLFRCNLACAGCGKIQFPPEVLKQHLSPEQCFQAIEECGAPIVSIPGGEPLLHPQIDEIASNIVKQKKYVYLCTNGMLLKKKLHLFTPSKYLTFSVHIDGLKEEHDRSVCKKGGFELTVEGIKAALEAGFRVTTNTTLYHGADPERIRMFFDAMTDLGVESMTISPGYSYEKAPDQEHFLHKQRAQELFRKLLNQPKRRWRFNQSPLFLEFLKGNIDYQCTPWGNPTFNIFGWQRPCYLFEDGHVQSFQELMENTEWERYGPGKHEQCADCMVHCGYEPSAVDDTFSSIRGFLRTVKAALSYT